MIESIDELLSRLDPHLEQAGEKYVQLHRALVNFFSFKGGSSPEDLADETINRVIRKIVEGVKIGDPVAYTWGVARYVLLENLRNQPVSIEDLSPGKTPASEPGQDGQESEGPGIRYECAKRCWRKLPAGEQQLLREWHGGKGRARIENRRRLAERLEIKIEELRGRIFKIKQKLRECRTKCLMNEYLKKTRGKAK